MPTGIKVLHSLFHPWPHHMLNVYALSWLHVICSSQGQMYRNDSGTPRPDLHCQSPHVRFPSYLSQLGQTLSQIDLVELILRKAEKWSKCSEAKRNASCLALDGRREGPYFLVAFQWGRRAGWIWLRWQHWVEDTGWHQTRTARHICSRLNSHCFLGNP